MPIRFFSSNALVILFLLTSSIGTIPAAAQTVTVTVSPSSVGLRAGATAAFVASVSGSTNQAVVWSVNAINGGNATVGTISSTGSYQAPAQVPASNIITIRATSVANSSASGASALTLLNPVVNVTSVVPAEVNANIPLSFSVYGNNFLNSAKVKLGGIDLVTTFVSSTELRATGAANLLPADSFAPLVVTNPDPGSTVAGAGVTVLPAVRVSVTPSASLRSGMTQQLEVQVDNNSNKSVTWKVNDITGGNATVGTITTAGLYTAPAIAPTSGAVSIKATSVADPTASATCAMTVMNAVASVTSVVPAEINVNVPLSFKVFGSLFVNGAKVTIGNKDLVTTFVSSTELNATGAVGLLPTGFAALMVVNPGLGGAGSGAGVIILPAVVVNLTPSANVRCGTTRQLELVVDHTTNKSVTWTINNIAGGNATVGTITSGGLYTAPAIAPASPVTVKATSVADPTASAICTVTLMNVDVSVTSVQPAEINVNVPLSFKVVGTAFVSGAKVKLGDKDLVVTFISSTELRATGATGLLPTGPAALVVTNPGAGAGSSGAGVMILPAVVVHVTPEISLRCGTTNQLEAFVDYNTNKTVTWSVNGIVGGNTTVGTISTSGLYTSPAVAPVSGSISIKATSIADATASGTCAVNLVNAVPAITSAPASVKIGSLVMTVSGSGFARGAKVKLGSQTLTTTWVSSTRLDATGTAAPVFGGRVVVKVSNPDPGAADSNTRIIQIAPATPLVTAQAAARFLAQASWGPDPESIARVQEIGFAAYLEEQFNAPMSDYPEPPASDDMQAPDPAQWRFFANGLTGQDQLRQRVAFAWSQIFVVSALKSSTARQIVPYMRLLHTNAFGNYLTLVGEVTVSPTMGYFLDMANNYKAFPGSGTEPNENYARELLQLFSVGPVKLNRDGSTKLDAQGQPIPAYDQLDVVNLSRALTGWTYPSKTGTPATAFNPPHFTGILTAIPQYHDTTAKTFLDGYVLPAGSTAEQDLMAAVVHISDHPNVAPFISRRLIQHLVTSNPSPAYIDRVAAVFNSDGTGQRGNLRSVVKAILLDSEARRGDASDATLTQGHLREPVYFIIGLLRALKATVPEQHSLAELAADMGQRLFYAPSVFNYFSPLYRIPSSGLVGPEYEILTPSTALIRANFVDSLAMSADPPAGLDLTPLAQLAEQPDALIEALNHALMQGQMSQAMKATISGTITPLDNWQRACTALFLVASSSQYQVQR